MGFPSTMQDRINRMTCLSRIGRPRHGNHNNLLIVWFPFILSKDWHRRRREYAVNEGLIAVLSCIADVMIA